MTAGGQCPGVAQAGDLLFSRTRSPLRGAALLDKVRRDFLGLDTFYPTAGRHRRRRVFLDSAASALMMGPAYRVAREFLDHYSNSHSQLHYGARIASDALRWARERVLSFAGADPDEYVCMFMGSGSTGAINKFARLLAASRPWRDTVVLSAMEHHSNDLPHRKHAGRVLHVPVKPGGNLDLAALRQAIDECGIRLNYVAISAASNVTGMLNPIHDIAEMAHEFDAITVVDASQLVAHAPLRMGADPRRKLDVVIFSGHKVYAPGAPGVVIARREIAQRCDPACVGGGMIEEVFLDRYTVDPRVPERHEAGTPNLVGAVLVGAALEILGRIGPELLHEHAAGLSRAAIDALAGLPGARIYGDTRAARTGIVSFNLTGVDHPLVAAVLNDYYNVAVRNECFCAQPYVRALLNMDGAPVHQHRNGAAMPGMVRASFGLYSTPEDVAALIAALRDIQERPGHFASLYRWHDGYPRHIEAFVPTRTLFDPFSALDRALLTGG